MKKIFLLKRKLILVWFFLPIFGFSQEGLGLWAGATIEKDFKKKWEISASRQSRRAGNFRYVQNYLNELGLSYQLTPKIGIFGCYRMITRRKDETKDFKIFNRYYFDLSYSEKIDIIRLKYRLRYQHQFKDDEGEFEFDSNYIRNKIEVSYPTKSDWTPYVSADLFYEVGKKIDQLRPKIGVEYKINKKNSLNFSVFTNLNLIEEEKTNLLFGVFYKLKI